MTRDRAQYEPGPFRDVQLLVDVVQVNFHRAFPDPKLICNDFIREALGNEVGYLRFPGCHRCIAGAISRPTI